MIAYSEIIHPAKITAETRFLFNFFRVLSALLVVISHVEDYSSLSLAPFSKFGHEAVVVFFVLSGALIGRSTLMSRRTFSEFFAVRMARIYSIVLPGLLASFSLFLLVGMSDVSAYLANYYPSNFSMVDAFGGLMFLTQSWGVFEPIPYNAPFWTMSYHVWYYMIFGVIYYCTGWYRSMFAVVVALIAGPSIVVLLPIWFFGYWLGVYGVSYRMPQKLAWAILLSTVILLIAARYWVWDQELRVILNANVSGFWRLAGSQRFLTDYVYGVIFIMQFIALISLSPVWQTFAQHYENRFAKLSNCTFTVYMFHYPLIFILNAMGVVGIYSLLQIPIIIFICYMLSNALNKSYPFYLSGFDWLGAKFSKQHRVS